MKNIWKFYSKRVSGIVIAKNKEEAIKYAKYYLSIQFDDIFEGINTDEVSVWKITTDDDYRSDYPYGCAISY